MTTKIQSKFLPGDVVRLRTPAGRKTKTVASVDYSESKYGIVSLNGSELLYSGFTGNMLTLSGTSVNHKITLA